MIAHGASAIRATTKLTFCSVPSAQTVRGHDLRCQCSSGRPDNDNAWQDVHMPALRERLEHIRQLGSLDGSDLPDGASLTIEGRSIKHPVWTIRGEPSGKPHSFRDEYWLRADDRGNNSMAYMPSRFSPDGARSLHSQFQSYVQVNSDRLDIAGRPPMPNRIDMALSMEKQWEEMSEEIEKWHKQKWERLAEDQGDEQ